MSLADQPELVSIHGGHSGQFCHHAEDSLEDIVKAYIDKGYLWIGISEHIPPVDDRFLWPDEIEAGLDAKKLYENFSRYISTCRELQRKYLSVIKIYVGFETETCSGSEEFVKHLVQKFQPDYIVGSVHHVNDIGIDYSKRLYGIAARAAGGLDGLYRRYFDQQFEMINRLEPSVVGHFDLVRIFDPDYKSRLKKPDILKRIRRNLERIKILGLILDFNVRALLKGADEPYISKPILLQAMELGIPVAPGDDSHGVDTAGLNMEKGIRILQSLGFKTEWQRPSLKIRKKLAANR